MSDGYVFDYPIYKKCKRTGAVVRFTSLGGGEVIAKGDTDCSLEKGTISEMFYDHTDIRFWKYCEPPKGEEQMTKLEGLTNIINNAQDNISTAQKNIENAQEQIKAMKEAEKVVWLAKHIFSEVKIKDTNGNSLLIIVHEGAEGATYNLLQYGYKLSFNINRTREQMASYLNENNYTKA